MSDLAFDAASHTYRLNGHVVPHVTGVIDALSSYYGVPEAVLKRKAEIGDAVHYATELDDEGDLDDASLPDVIRGYVEAWRAFKRDTGWRTQVSELRVHSATYRYAGTLDAIGHFEGLRGIKPTVPCIVDKKCTFTILPCVGPQLAAYLQAVNESGAWEKPIARRFAVQLKPDGTCNLHECKDVTDWSVYLSALTIKNWRERHNINRS